MLFFLCTYFFELFVKEEIDTSDKGLLIGNWTWQKWLTFFSMLHALGTFLVHFKDRNRSYFIDNIFLSTLTFMSAIIVILTVYIS